MKKFTKYLIIVIIVLVCIYGFWAWLQYKWATVIKKTTTSIITQLATIQKLETAQQEFTETLQGEQQLLSLIPDIGIDQIVSSALFSNGVTLEVQWIITAGYELGTLASWAVQVDRDGTVIITLGDPTIFETILTWELQTSKLGIVTPNEIRMEKTLRTKAWDIMVQKALSGGILEEAKNNAPALLQDILLKAGIQIKNVIISWSTITE
jgi:hypothetical protein